MRHSGHGCRNRSPEARRKHRRRRGSADRVRRVRRPAGPGHLLAARNPRGPQADPHRGAGLRGRGGHPPDRHRPTRHRFVDAPPVRERPRVRRRPANHRRHAGNRQDGRRRSLRRRSLHAGLCGGDARARRGGRRRRRRRPGAGARPHRRRLDGQSRDLASRRCSRWRGLPIRLAATDADPAHPAGRRTGGRPVRPGVAAGPTGRCWRGPRSRRCSSTTC